MARVRVPSLASSKIVIAPGSLSRLGRLLRGVGFDPGPCALVTDRNVDRHHGAAARRALRGARFAPTTLVLAPGERSKSLAVVERLYRDFAAAGIARDRPVIALGGGVVGDVAGFAAATWLRGVPLVQVPTSLLAQVDASVGGKVAVDLEIGKNLVGAFHAPRLVVSDPRTLSTLSPRHLRAGLAEAVKVGFALDRRLVRFLERRANHLLAGDPAALAEVVRRCVRAKLRVVRADERDGGPRQLLNYGHTVGHALEAVGGYQRWTHGEAIALGMEVEARAAINLGLLEPEVGRRQSELLEALGLPRRLSGISANKTLSVMQLDKKARAGKLRFVLTRGVGVASFGHLVSRAEVVAALRDAGADP